MAKMNLSTASRKNTNAFDLSSTHVTTMDFDSYRITNYIPCVPGDKFDINYSQFTRLSPLAVPTFGAFKLKTFAFFVPYRVVWRDFESWYSQSVDSSVSFGKAFTIKVKDISKIFYSNGVGTITNLTENGTSSDFDVCYTKYTTNDTSQTVIYRKLTNRGRVVFNVLKCLGYPLTFAMDSNTSSPSYAYANTSLSALPLLVFARVLYDWLYPSSYVQQQGFKMLFDNALTELNEGWIVKFLDLIFCAYDADFFTRSWLYFNSPAYGYSLGNDISIGASPTSNTLDIRSNDYGNSVHQSAAGNEVTLSTYSLRLLQSVSDYVTRNNLVGSRFFERVKARFGFTTQEQRHDFSSFLKVWVDPVKLMDVTATTATDSQMLGEQAGKGYSQSSPASLHFTANEHGALIFLSQIVPSIGYVQGQKPWTRGFTDPKEWYTPEFDNVGMQPLPARELFSDGYNNYLAKCPWFLNDSVFGFAPRYSEYKHGFDYLSGDLTIHSRGGDLSGPYHTFRMFTGPTSANASTFAIPNDAEFRRVDNQYNRVFAADPTDSSGASDYDHFFTIFNFNVTAHRHMLSISESVPLFNKSGRAANFDYLGESFH